MSPYRTAFSTSLVVLCGGLLGTILFSSGCQNQGSHEYDAYRRPTTILRPPAGDLAGVPVSAADAYFPGWGEHGKFVRVYNPELAPSDGPFGFGWTHSFNMSLVEKADGKISLSDAQGHAVRFVPRGDSRYTTDAASWTLKKNADGTFALADAAGWSWSFSGKGRLATLSDGKKSLNMTYGADGLLVSIAEGSNWVIRLSYDQDRRITGLTDVAGGACRYAYDAHGDLVGAISADKSSQYQYDQQHRLTGVSSGAQDTTR